MGGTAYTRTQLEGERMFPNVGDDSETTQTTEHSMIANSRAASIGHTAKRTNEVRKRDV